VSIGLARAAEAVDGTQLLALADQRLYTAKRQGRNRVVSEG
jgi:PleD family two-component response regulator